MKVANPDRTLGEVMAEEGKRPHGWYDLYTLSLVVRQCFPDLVQIDVMDAAGLERLTADMKTIESHPWRYVVDKGEGEMVRVRALRQANRVTETQPQRLSSRAWETNPGAYFGDGLVPGTTILADSEHDPRLGSEPRWEDE